MDLVYTNLKDVKNIILILSGKGGVGKSFIASSLAIALKELGYSVGLLDIDIHGPSIPWILGIENTFMGISIDGKLIPPEVNGIAVVSFELMLEHKDSPIVWRGPLKTRAITEILMKTKWGLRDFIIVDMPPGMGDEHLTIIHILKPWVKGGILVLTPGKLVEHVVRKTKKFLDEAGVRLLGAILNMAYFRCANCGSIHKLFGDYGDSYVEILLEIPINPMLSQAIGDGKLLDYLYNHDKELLNMFTGLCSKLIQKING